MTLLLLRSTTNCYRQGLQTTLAFKAAQDDTLSQRLYLGASVVAVLERPASQVIMNCIQKSQACSLRRLKTDRVIRQRCKTARLGPHLGRTMYTSQGNHSPRTSQTWCETSTSRIESLCRCLSTTNRVTLSKLLASPPTLRIDSARTLRIDSTS